MTQKKIKPELNLSTFGFTLIELLVTLAILAVILLVAISIFMSVLIRSTKVKVVKTVENEGYYALRIMERTIRNAKEVRGNCQQDMNDLTIINNDDQSIVLSCLYEGNPNGYIGLTGTTSQRLTSPEVRLDSCRIDCYSGSVNEPDRVNIAFSLSQAKASDRPEERATLDFQTQVTMRNY